MSNNSLHAIHSFSEHDVSQSQVEVEDDFESHINEMASTEFIDLQENVSHFHTHPFQTGPAARKQEPVDASHENSDNFCPFKLDRAYGRLKDVPAINFTGSNHKNAVLYATSNVIILLNYFKNTQKCIQGHRQFITTLVLEQTSRYFLSGASGKGCCMIIWDSLSLVPLKKFVGPHDGYGILNGAFSGVDCLFATLGAEPEGNQKICLWSHDPKEPKSPISTCEVPLETGIQRKIYFAEQINNYFATIGDTYVLFYTWMKTTQSVHVHKTKVPLKFITRMKRFTGGVWMKNDTWFVTVTMLGFAVVWEKPMGLGLKPPLDPTKNIKEYKRSFKLSENGVTSITKYKDYLIIGDEKGTLRFFDEGFRIVRWTSMFMLSDPIASVSFNQTELTPDFVQKMHLRYTGGRHHIHHDPESVVMDYTFGGEKTRILSETSLERPPLTVPDFTVCVENGNMYYCHFMEGKVDLLVPGAPAPWVAIDACPNTTHIVLCSRNGEIQVFDYSCHKIMESRKAFRKAVTIICMKFHPLGELVFFGAHDGRIHLRHNNTWLNVQKAVGAGTTAIQKISFSVDGSFMGYFDAGGLVAVYHYEAHRGLWDIFGKNLPHTKDVVDLQFFTDKITNCSRMFSLGADRRLVEYDLFDFGSGTLSILNTFFVEQTCVPTSMTFVCPEEFGDHCVLIHNKLNKLRVFDYEQGKVMKTCQGPLFGGERLKKMIPYASPKKHTVYSNYSKRKLIVFCVDNKLGLVTTPVDGNPNRYMAILAHPENVLDIVTSPDQQYVFTIGKNDKCVYCWKPELEIAEAAVLLGGTGTIPYVHTLKQNWPDQDIIKDIDMIVFHLNLKRVRTQSEMITMPKVVKLNEIAAVCRTCGFFLTEYEIDVMLTEAVFMLTLQGSEKNDEVAFDEFIKMFANHYYSTTNDDIQWAFSILGKTTDEDGIYIPGDWFTHYMCARGEPMLTKSFEELFVRVLRKLSPVPPRTPNPSEEFKSYGVLPVPEIDTNIKVEIGTIDEQQQPNISDGVNNTGELQQGVPAKEESLGDVGLPEAPAAKPTIGKVELLTFLDTMFPLFCQDAIKWQGKPKDEDKNFGKLQLGSHRSRSEDLHARKAYRDKKRFYLQKALCLIDPENPIYEKLLCAFETQIFQLTGKRVERHEIADGARMFLEETGPQAMQLLKKAAESDDDDKDESDEIIEEEFLGEGGNMIVDKDIEEEEVEEEELNESETEADIEELLETITDNEDLDEEEHYPLWDGLADTMNDYEEEYWTETEDKNAYLEKQEKNEEVNEQNDEGYQDYHDEDDGPGKNDNRAEDLAAENVEQDPDAENVEKELEAENVEQDLELLDSDDVEELGEYLSPIEEEPGSINT